MARTCVEIINSFRVPRFLGCSFSFLPLFLLFLRWGFDITSALLLGPTTEDVGGGGGGGGAVEREAVG